MNKTCAHLQTRSVRTRCFDGPVIGEDNPSAHGGVCVTEECDTCGARRDTNVNQIHTEVGEWSVSRAERQAVAVYLRNTAKRLLKRIEPIRMARNTQVITLRLDHDGYVLGDNMTTDVKEAFKATPLHWFESAVAARRAVIAAEKAEANI